MEDLEGFPRRASPRMVEPLVSFVRAARGSASMVSTPMDRWTPMKTPQAGPAPNPTRAERRTPPDPGRPPLGPSGGPLPEQRLLVGPDRRRLHRRRPRRLSGVGSGVGRQLAVHPQSDPVPVIGRVDRLSELVDRVGATDLVVALSGRPAGGSDRGSSNSDGATSGSTGSPRTLRGRAGSALDSARGQLSPLALARRPDRQAGPGPGRLVVRPLPPGALVRRGRRGDPGDDRAGRSSTPRSGSGRGGTCSGCSSSGA